MSEPDGEQRADEEPAAEERDGARQHADEAGDAGAGTGEPGTGKVFGVPYDWRRPTVARVKSRWWNPNDHRVITPKSYGWGYDFNLYEVGRRLRLIRRER